MSKVKIAYLDIETMAAKGWVWGKWEQNVIAFEKDWYILCFGVKWNDGTTKVYSLPQYDTWRNDKENDIELLRELHRIFEEADLIVAHNGDQFDIKKINARFLFHGFKPPAPYKTVDTKKIAKRNFGLLSNSLDDIGHFLGVGRKKSHSGFQLWRDCATGKRKAWSEMREYCKQDVDLLYSVYQRLRPWAQNLNLSVITRELACPSCQSHKMQQRGYRFTIASKFPRFQCIDCGRWCSGTSEKIDKIETR